MNRFSLLGLLCAVSCGLVAQAQIPVNPDALQRAIEDLGKTHPDTYPGATFLQRLEASRNDPAALQALQRESLMANPLLNFDQLLIIRRSERSPQIGLPANWQGNCSLPRKGYDNEIAVMPLRSDAPLRTVYKPEKDCFLGDVDLEFDATRMLFSMQGSNDRYQIWEVGTDGAGLRQVTLGEESDVDNYDACYLPDGRIIYDTTAFYQGIPCVYGGDAVANLCVMNADGSGMRQLCFDQDHDWSPTVLNNGRVLYTRWEYTDLPHSNTRLLFHANPDGTEQMEYYGSNSYWPTSVMYARPVPGHSSMVATIVTGHHGVPRMGELLLLDPAKGRYENTGVVQRIPGFGKPVEPIVKDNLVDDSWPKFLHPWPLSDKYLIVACKPTPESRWGIYLVDVFDNMLLLREESGQALLEPIPLQARTRPPVIPEKIKPAEKEATVYLSDVYAGPGLAGVPRGTVKQLRVFTYTYSYRGMGGLMGVVGMDGPWDVKNILGTVPVESDGSALFTVPANTPISVQPLDAEGKAVQLMRSWFTGMPGEKVTCTGCHDRQNTTPPQRPGAALRRAPSVITPWRGPARGFSFDREVQPVLDRHCLRCHTGLEEAPDFHKDRITDWKSAFPGSYGPPVAGNFSRSYAELHRFVRRPGIESDYHLLTPLEYHADTTELVQMLRKGHHGVSLSSEDWDRLTTWIDLNTPFHGTWTEIVGQDTCKPKAERRRTLFKKYAGMDWDPEAIYPATYDANSPELPITAPAEKQPATAGWPVSPEDAAKQQRKAGHTNRAVDLGDGITLELAYVPGGQFRMGDDVSPAPDEKPAHTVKVKNGFWMGRCEISNRQFRQFKPEHDSRIESMHGYQFGIHGYPLNESDQPVARVSWEEATAFCKWLSEKTGKRFTLPTEAQWEYACRAGSATPFSYGGPDADFSSYANLGDAKLREFARNTYVQVNLIEKPNKYDDWIPKDDRFNDGGFVSASIGSYQPNIWGLCDMHGNVWEWTQSLMKPYPYSDKDGRNDNATEGKRVVRGGSWYDRPRRSTSSFRLAYEQWQRVFNVGFRVVVNEGMD